MSCCGAASWKREHIADHKFDLIDVEDFVDRSFLAQVRYSWVFFNTLKSVLVYMADLGVVLLIIYSAATLGAPCVSPSAFAKTQNSDNSNSTQTTAQKQDLACRDTTSDTWGVPINGKVRFGLTLATISLSYILLALEWKKGLAIVKSKDISYAFTNTVAYRYYVIRSFGHFCLFSTIESTRKLIDEVAFWVFFTFRGWKRLLLAELPRQLLNLILLQQTYNSIMTSPKITSDRQNCRTVKPGTTEPLAGCYLYYTDFCAKEPISGQIILNTSSPLDPDNFFDCVYATNAGFLATFKYLMILQPADTPKLAVWLASITVAMWAISAILLAAAFIVYIPLLCNIRGNLKEYCCHKVDKRIDEVLKRKQRKREEQARKREQQEIAKYGKVAGPTLPSVDMDDIGSTTGHPTYPHQQHLHHQYSLADSASSSQLLPGGGVDHGAGYAYSAGPGSSYGESNGGGSMYGGGARAGQISPVPPMPNPYVRTMANYAPGPVLASPGGGGVGRYDDLQSEYGGSQAPTHYSGRSAGGGGGAGGYYTQPPQQHPQAYHMHQGQQYADDGGAYSEYSYGDEQGHQEISTTSSAAGRPPVNAGGGDPPLTNNSNYAYGARDYARQSMVSDYSGYGYGAPVPPVGDAAGAGPARRG
ncbi:hypothetical protein HDU87_007708 [Geranomyces variabilis]|uniref:Vacuole protein n=1 Tax=Geranomyces variabilis TaxID=109894 RepID=A0AAD5TFF6_9FUNG|nr:hypothetical protein HDU87_007708 [Geranomyces variabilis]